MTTLFWPTLSRVKAPRAWLAALFWLVLALVVAVLPLLTHKTRNVDHTVLGFFSVAVLPLLSYAIVGVSIGTRRSLLDAVIPLLRFGAPPLKSACATLVVATASAAAVCFTLGVLVVLVAGGRVADAWTTGWISGLGASAYAALFTWGAAYGAKGAGRSFLLGVDWIFGSTSGAFGAVFPRAHIRNLLGGTPAAELSSRASSATLVLLTLVFGLCACLAARRAARFSLS